MADTNVVRTVFKTEWLGAGVVQNMIRKYGMAEKAVKSMQGAGSAGGSMYSAVAMARANKMSAVQGKLAARVAEGTMEMSKAQAVMTRYTSLLDTGMKSAGGFAEATGVMGTGMSALTVTLGAVAVGLGAVVLGFKALYPILEEGANIAQLDQSFQHLNATMTDSPNLLNDMKEASRGTLSTMAAQEGFMTLVAGSSKEMTQALADAAPRILEISKAANKLNPNLGTTNFMFTSLAKGLKRAEPRLIDNLGLKLRVSDANRAMADDLGKSVMALTAEEKQMAILNETLKAGTKLIEQVGGSVDGLGDSFQRVDATTTDFKNSFKEILALTMDISGLTDGYVTSLDNVTKGWEMNAKASLALKDGIIDQELYNKFMVARGKIDDEVSRKQVQNMLITMDLLRQKKQLLLDYQQAKMDDFQSEKNLFDTGGMIGPQPAPTVEGVGPDDGDRRFGSAAQRRLAAIRQNALDAQADANDESKKLFDVNATAAQKWADDINKASEDAIKAWHEYTASLGDMAEGHIDAERKTSFYTTSIDALGDSYRAINPLTPEQTENLERLEKKLESTRVKMGDMTLGLGQFGRKEKAIAKSTGRLAADIGILEGAISAYGDTETKYEPVHQDAIWNWKNLTTAMTDVAKAADLGVRDFVRYKMGIGELTEEQAEATIAATAMESEMGRIFDRVKLGEIDPAEAKAELEKFSQWLGQQDLSVFLTPRMSPTTTTDADLARLLPEGVGTDGFSLDAIIEAERAESELWRKLMGEEPMPPLPIVADIDLEPMDNAITAWIEENNVITFTGKFDFDDAPTGMPWPTGAGHAYGGSVVANTPIIVGEQGPELITPGSNSTVTPNNQLGGMTMNTSIVVNGNVGTDDLVSIVDDALTEALQQVGVL